MHIKYWMYQPERMLVVHLPEERRKEENYISALLAGAYSIWISPDESYDDEDVIEEIYDTECEVFLMNELHDTLGYKLNWMVTNCGNENDADYVLVGL